MIIVIPLGGIGQRFKDNKYILPKALIKVFGKPILYYLLDNLNLTNIKFIYIPYNKEYEKYRFQDTLKKDYPDINFRFFLLEENTCGALHTLNIALNNLTGEELNNPLLSLDCDNFYLNDIIKDWNQENKVFCCVDESETPIYSYILEKDNIITNIKEKVKISNYACTGAYGFKSAREVLYFSKELLNNENKTEFYISYLIEYMIKHNNTFVKKVIDANNWNCLGTPIQLKQFYNNYPAISCLNSKKKIKNLRICFDLDNTLVTFPKIRNDYSSVEPIQNNIDFLKYLKKLGCTIIIYTARRMRTSNGNIGKVMNNIGKITFDTLEKFDILYDEIYFGKPYADVYIDDLALSCFNDLEKELGFYKDHIKPRDFNNLNQDILNIYTKESINNGNNLSGEIYYYKNIPQDIKDMFPLFIDFDINNKWYKMEKIKGLTVSNMYLSELLTQNNLIHIMNSIKRIHNSYNDNKDIDKKIVNIYSNYCDKMEIRKKEYDFSKLIDFNETYKNIFTYLKKYETNKEGKKVVIHGDTVMTNIIINNHGKIKFIDMRGKLGNNQTILGDYLYDWAKLYQSLIGYDSILLNKTISTDYQDSIIRCFKEYFLESYSIKEFNNLKYITKSLLITLIPLHNNNNCINYYELIKSKYLEINNT